MPAGGDQGLARVRAHAFARFRTPQKPARPGAEGKSPGRRAPHTPVSSGCPDVPVGAGRVARSVQLSLENGASGNPPSPQALEGTATTAPTLNACHLGKPTHSWGEQESPDRLAFTKKGADHASTPSYTRRDRRLARAHRALLGNYPAIRWEAIAPFVPEDCRGLSVLDLGSKAGFFGCGSECAARRMCWGWTRSPSIEQGPFAAHDLTYDMDYRCMQVQRNR